MQVDSGRQLVRRAQFAGSGGGYLLNVALPGLSVSTSTRIVEEIGYSAWVSLSPFSVSSTVNFLLWEFPGYSVTASAVDSDRATAVYRIWHEFRYSNGDVLSLKTTGYSILNSHFQFRDTTGFGSYDFNVQPSAQNKYDPIGGAFETNKPVNAVRLGGSVWIDGTVFATSQNVSLNVNSGTFKILVAEGEEETSQSESN